MDVGALKPQPQVPVAFRPALKIDPVPPVAAVSPKAATLQAQQRAAPAAERASEAPLARDQVVERDMTIDPQTQTMVYQALNARGDVILQVPDQALLRQRAYDRETAAFAEDQAGPPKVVLSA